MIYIKQYGAKRTGTNYLRWLLENNFDDITVLSNILGWKHGLHSEVIDWSGKDWDHRRPESSKKLASLVTPDIRNAHYRNEICYIISSKNPYSYYVSHITKWGKSKSLEYAKNLISRWNILYENWLLFHESYELSIIINFEDLLQNKKSTLNLIASKFGLPFIDNIEDTNRQLRALNETTRNMKKFTKNKFNSKLYKNNNYMKYIHPKILSIINNVLDKKVMDKLSYRLLGE